ncbi:MAG TPA: GyrI-like domain-containing protein [Bacteroidales bacterium]|nr:GyrI-like domain-containing protein [Bacteroidales bacterium]
MNTTIIPPFDVIGIAVRTTNENGQSAKDLGNLWARFMTEKIADKIPNKVDHSIYCIYTDYEKDFTKPYTAIIGCKVERLDEIPEGLTGKRIQGAEYAKFIAKGNDMQKMVGEAWYTIWNTDLARKYTADFEVYSEKSYRTEGAEVDIYVSVG